MSNVKCYGTLNWENGIAPSSVIRHHDGLGINGKMTVEIVEGPEGVRLYPLLSTSHIESSGENGPMVQETMDVVSARAKGYELELAALRQALDVKEAQIVRLTEMNQKLQDSMLEMFKLAMEKLEPKKASK